jgi:hypothetical protein
MDGRLWAGESGIRGRPGGQSYILHITIHEITVALYRLRARPQPTSSFGL